MSELQKVIEIQLELYIGQAELSHFHQEVELLYVMEGRMEAAVRDEHYQMKEDDILIINSNKAHTLRPGDDCLFCRIHIPYRLLSDAVHSQTVLFWCNSVAESSESYRELRYILQQLINDYVNGRKDRYFYRYSLCYQLLHHITSYYLVTKEDFHAEEKRDRQEERLDEIVNYVQSNYNRAISLQELSDHLYLSKHYLTKYIKKNFGMTFLEYLNNIRIHHAMDDLLHTENTIIHVAMDNGFPNVATFNRLFKEYYRESPAAYRQKKKSQPDKKEASVSEEKKQELQERLEQYFMTGQIQKQEEMSDLMEIEGVYGEGKPYRPGWNQILNVGAASELLDFAMREQIRKAKADLGFRYARFWNIFSEDMFFSEDVKAGQYNFEKLDSVLDFCVEQDILPFIELGEKPRRIQRTVARFVLEPDNKTIFAAYDEWKKTLEILMRHLVSHYGEDQVARWKFELWDDRREETHFERPDYGTWFKDTRTIIKSYFPDTQVGGAGRHLGWFKEHTTEGIRAWVDSGIYPDFLTYCYFPYSSGEINREVYSKRKTDEDDLLHTLEGLREELLRWGFPPREIYITDWNGTASDRNYINDSCWKGAWMMKSYFDALGKADVLAYNCLSDLSGQYYDTQGILNGCRGLISKDGIEKPGMHAMRFLGLLKPYLIGAGKNYLITTDRQQRTVIACHNFKERNYLYYVKAEDEIEPRDQYRFFHDQDAKHVKLRLENMRNGEYLQKTYTFNREHGSILDEWMKMDCIRHLRKDEIDYLRNVCLPEIQLKKFTVQDGVAEREWHMQAHEIKVVELRFLC